MRSSFPEFEKVGIHSGGVIYRRAEGQRFFFVLLWLHSKFDEFTLELASAMSAEYPFHLMPGDFSEACSRWRIRLLPEQKMGLWWQVNTREALIESMMPRSEFLLNGPEAVPALVAQSIEALAEALPGFVACVLTR